jgi:hypothetical protein
VKNDQRDDLDEKLDRFERKLPDRVARFVRWARRPTARAVRLPLGFGLIVVGAFGFLPLIGFWMIPLGLVLVAQDVPFLRPPLARFIGWAERKWPQGRSRSSSSDVR